VVGKYTRPVLGTSKGGRVVLLKRELLSEVSLYCMHIE